MSFPHTDGHSLRDALLNKKELNGGIVCFFYGCTAEAIRKQTLIVMFAIFSPP